MRLNLPDQPTSNNERIAFLAFAEGIITAAMRDPKMLEALKISNKDRIFCKHDDVFASPSRFQSPFFSVFAKHPWFGWMGFNEKIGIMFVDNYGEKVAFDFRQTVYDKDSPESGELKTYKLDPIIIPATGSNAPFAVIDPATVEQLPNGKSCVTITNDMLQKFRELASSIVPPMVEALRKGKIARRQPDLVFLP